MHGGLGRFPYTQGKLRADVLHRVRANRTAILSRARGESVSSESLRDGVQEALREILQDELSRAKRVRLSSEATVSEDAAWAGGHDRRPSHAHPHLQGIPETPPETCAASQPSWSWPARQEDVNNDEMWDDILPTRTSRRRELSPRQQQGDPANTQCDNEEDDAAEGRRRAEGTGGGDVGGESSSDVPQRLGSGVSRGSSSSSLTWEEAAGTGSLSTVEYDELMCAMHASIEDELRAEEAALLAHELERAEAEDAHELDAALENFQNWELDTAASGAGDPAVLCPVCKARRLLQSSGTIFCGCGGLRLSREGSGEASGAGGGGGGTFGLDLLRSRLEEAWDAHGACGCDANDLSFSVRNTFGIEALYAECTRCSFLEAVL